MSSDRPTFEDRPPAKINLTLEVVGRRPDGFHELKSIFLRIGLSDRLTMRPGGADGSDTLTVLGLPGAPVRGNLVLRALDAIRARTDVQLPALDVTLEKNIPIAAGLGGGSSDAASAIKLAQAAWGIGLSQAEELAIGASIGSDVPFFLSGFPTALVTGRGEAVAPAGSVADVGLLLVTSVTALSTQKVFDRFDELAPGTTSIDEIAMPALDQLNSLASRFRDSNDLWPSAASLDSSLAAARTALEVATQRPWMLSGSGPTMFAIYASAAEAAEVGQRLAAGEMAALAGAQINAVDLIGPDPAWRYP